MKKKTWNKTLLLPAGPDHGGDFVVMDYHFNHRRGDLARSTTFSGSRRFWWPFAVAALAVFRRTMTVKKMRSSSTGSCKEYMVPLDEIRRPLPATCRSRFAAR